MTGPNDTKKRATCSLCKHYESHASFKFNWCDRLKRERAIDDCCKHFHPKGK